MKCVKCDQEATYDSPDAYCDRHWFEWWTEGWLEDGATEEEIEEAWQEHCQTIRRLEDTPR